MDSDYTNVTSDCGMITLWRDGGHKITFDISLIDTTRPRGYKTFFVLNSTKHENFLAHKC